MSLTRKDLGDLTIFCGYKTTDLERICKLLHQIEPSSDREEAWFEFPETKKHPREQLEIAHDLARRVNSGEQVVIVTHSDYIAKEINTMLMIGNLPNSTIKELGYEGITLRTSQVKNYIVKGTEITEIKPFDDGGFEFPTFDEVIDPMNELHQKVWFLIDQNKD